MTDSQPTTGTTLGHRVMPDAEGYLPTNLQPGAYGHAVMPDRFKDSASGWWQCVAPNGDGCSLDPAVHRIVEHEDSTITVTPSIVMPNGGRWHGFLERGVWRQV